MKSTNVVYDRGAYKVIGAYAFICKIARPCETRILIIMVSIIYP